jgi:4-alpha-glucanotransferase
VLLHPTSFPDGRLGRDAYAFVDWLAEAGQRYWQVLPLGPPDEWGSPYAGLSAFAGWGGLLADPDAHVSPREEADFRRRHAYWADDWASHAGTPGEMAVQVRFEREWSALRTYAKARGIRIVGDLPLYVGRRSADVAAHPELFDRSLSAGVPPDIFSTSGQMWGNPPYRWDVLQRTGYRWWIERFRHELQLFDALRLDHFRGYVAYWAVPRRNRTARNGSWRRGPGHALFAAVRAELGALPAIAEDLGYVTEPIRRLRDDLGLPGIQILQWSLGGKPLEPRVNAVVYSGTHDNDTARGWWDHARPRARRRFENACAQARIDPDDPAWAIVELTLAARARLAVVPVQDILGLGSEARMNVPSTTGQNWKWRLEPGQLTSWHSARLQKATRRWGRLAR